MSSERSLTPLGYVQDTFWRYSDRNPVDEEAVFHMMEAAAQDTLGLSAANAFADALSDSLNPDSTKGFGAANALHLEEIGERACDKETPVVVRWGAIATLGALGSVYDEVAVTAPDYDPRTRHEQVASHVAYNTLQQVVNDPDFEVPYKTVAKAFLAKQPKLLSEDLGAELGLYTESNVLKADTGTPPPAEIFQTEDTFEPVKDKGEVAFTEISENIPRVLKKLPWVQPALEAAPLYEISQDAKGATALVYDLTGCHKTLAEYFEDVKNAAVSKTFWSKLQTGITQHTLNKGTSTHKIRRQSYVPTYYLTNRGSRNEDSLRIYYVNMGTTEEEVPVFGMIAACRTKAREHTTLRIITGMSDNNKDSEA